MLGRCRPDARVLLLLRLRLNALEDGESGDGGEGSSGGGKGGDGGEGGGSGGGSRSQLLTPVESDKAGASAALRFATHVLPRGGLHATELPIPEYLARDGSFRYFEVAAASPEAAALLVREAAAAEAAVAAAAAAAGGAQSVELGAVRGGRPSASAPQADGRIDIAAEVLSTEQGDELYCAPLEDMMAWGE